MSTARIQGLWDFERSAHFNEADRAALRFARGAASVPNAVTPQHYEDLRRHFSDEEIREIRAVIALTGFLNRYSDTPSPRTASVGRERCRSSRRHSSRPVSA